LTDPLLERAYARIKRSRVEYGDSFVHSTDAMLILELVARILELEECVRSLRDLPSSQLTHQAPRTDSRSPASPIAGREP